MGSTERQSNRFEFPEIWERIEISGFGGDRTKLDQVKYFLTLALNGTTENLEFTDKKITINNKGEINSALLKITINKMLERFEELEAVAF